jgi:tyrosine-protein kinase Etk/Wzc
MSNPSEFNATAQPRPADFVEDEIDLGDYIATILESKWLIATITAVVLALGLAYAFLATPIYRGDVLVQVEDKSSGVAGLEDLSAMFTGETPAETEIEIIRSRSVIGATVDQLGLDTTVEPKYFPIFGAAIARRQDPADGLAKAWFGLKGFAWGGERIQVERLQVPRDYEGEELTLVARGDGKYDLFGPDDELLLKGAVNIPAAGHGVKAFVTELVARPGTQFRLAKQSRAQTIGNLQDDLKVSEKGKKTGIIQIVLDGERPPRVAATLDAISTLYLRQNVERKSAEAEKTLEFLNTQLPDVKAKVDAAEARLNAYKSRVGSIDLTLEAQAVLDKTADIEKALTELDLKRKELLEKFTESHPALITLKQKKEQLEAERAALEGQIKNMPEEAQESIRLARDVKVANELYVLMLNKAQEMNVLKAGTIGNVRILDHALVGTKPVKPKKALTAALSLVVGMMLGIVAAFVRKSLTRGVEDPDLIEQRLGLSVYASIPHSDAQQRLVRKGRKNQKFVKLLALDDPKDLAIESLRSLRTSLQFALLDAKNQIVTITGPSPNIGKSFVAANLAYVLADAGKRTLLIDADMRKGHLHEYFGFKRTQGLSGLISGEVSMEQGIRKTGIDALDFIPSGIVPPNPSELLMSDRFKEVLDNLAGKYDLVIVDTPPVLAVTDATIVGRHAGVNFVVLRSGMHPLREIELSIKRLTQNGIKPQGFIVNDVALHSGRYGYGRYGRYGYHYQYEYK